MPEQNQTVQSDWGGRMRTCRHRRPTLISAEYCIAFKRFLARIKGPAYTRREHESDQSSESIASIRRRICTLFVTALVASYGGTSMAKREYAIGAKKRYAIHLDSECPIDKLQKVKSDLVRRAVSGDAHRAD